MTRIPDRPARRHASSGWVGLFFMLLVVVAGNAQAGVITIASNSSAASTDSGAIDTAGGYFTVQLCGGTGGDVFSGSFVVNQGSQTGKLVQTYSSGAISSLSGCSITYYVGSFAESALTQVVITRSAGTYWVWLVWSKK